MTANDPLMRPFKLKHLVLRNRIMSTAHEPGYSEEGMPKDRYRLYHLEKAKGGIALTAIGGSSVVAPDSSSVFGNLHAYKDEIVPWLKRLAEDCHAEGCAVMIQLTHLGRRTRWNQADWLPVVAPSPIREPAHRSFPKAAEAWDLDRIVEAYAAAAERMQAAGLDGIELQASGHLMDQFWSPATNTRDDAYGGSLDNRLRFSLRVLQAVRDRVGPRFIVGFRMVADEDWEVGLSASEGIEIAHRLVATGMIDFLNINRGHIETDAALQNLIPIHGMRSAPHLDFAGEVRKATGFPVFHAARIADIATARHAVAAGKVDMIGMTRAHIADPHIARKVKEGREHEIRPCVGATYCLDRIYEGHDALCIHNPAAGREATMPHVIDRAAGPAKRVVVIGAGPAGLEAARVSGERGHDVVVLEAAAEGGGQVRLAARHQRRRELIGIIEWRLERCRRLGVELRFDTWAEAGDVEDLDPDVVIVATGGIPDTAVLAEGRDLAVSTWDILSGTAKIAGNVLLFDDNGGHPGLQAAEVIAQTGAALEVVTPERFFAPEIGGLNHVSYARTLHETGAQITINKRLIAVRRDGNKLAALIGSDYGPRTDIRVVDQVVIEHGTLPLDEVYFCLRPRSINDGEVDYQALIEGRSQQVVRNLGGRFQLFRIGDAVASRNIHAAVFDGLRLCKNL